MSWADRILLSLALLWPMTASGAVGAIPIAKLDRSAPVDFSKEVLPILRNNCLACHNQTRAKAELILESPQTILKGSENGPVIAPGQSEKSLLLQVASHQATPTMPPRDNKVAAADLTSQELGLIALWIDQGARGEVHHAEPIDWQPLPGSYQPIYAVALSGDGQIAACSRGNRVFVYHLPSRRLLSTLADPRLVTPASRAAAAIAHRDSVHALSFSPDGSILASGGYREVKTWRRPHPVQTFQGASVLKSVTCVNLSPDGGWWATGDQAGQIEIRTLPSGAAAMTLYAGTNAIECLQFTVQNGCLLASSEGRFIQIWNVATGTLLAEARSAAAVSSLAWLDGGHGFVTGTIDGLVQVWTVSCQPHPVVAKSVEFQASVGEIRTVQALPGSSSEFLCASSDGDVRHWDISSGGLFGEIADAGDITALAVSSDCRRYALAVPNKAVDLWSTDNQHFVTSLKGDRYAMERVAAADRVWRFCTNEVAYAQAAYEAAEKERKDGTDRVRKASETIALADKDLEEKRKNLETAEQARATAEKGVAELNGALQQATETREKAEASAELARCEALARLQLFAQGGPQRETNASVDTREANEAESASAIDRLSIAAQALGEAQVDYARTVDEKKRQHKEAEDKLAQARKRKEEAEGQLKKAAQTQTNAQNELSLAISAAQKASDKSDDAQNAIPIAQTEAKRAQATLDAALQTARAAETPIRAAAFSPDNGMVATAGDDGLVHTWSAETGQAFESWPAQVGVVAALAFRSPTEVVALSTDGGAAGWNLNPDWTMEAVLGAGDADSPISDRANSLAFSPDGRTLAVGSGEPSRSGQIQLWSVVSGRLAQEFDNVHSDSVFGLDFSRTGQYLASGAADRFMRVTDLNSGRVVKSFEGHTHHVLGVAWKEDGRTLASAGADDVVKIWDFRSGERRKNVDGFEKEVTSICAFKGDQFLVTSGDHQVRIVNEKGETIRSLNGAKDFLYAAAATPDGKWIIAGGEDGVLWAWDGSTGELTAQLR